MNNVAKALEVAGLAPKKFPSVNETLMQNNVDKLKKESKDEKKKKKRRNVHFCVGTCDVWIRRNTLNDAVPVHVVLKRLGDKCNLKWPQISMSYHGFPNPRETF